MLSRKSPRLKNYDYSANGGYFVTVVTKNRKKVFSRIVGAGLCARPAVELTEAGRTAEGAIAYINNYESCSVEAYVIMPNHIHLLITKTGPGGRGDPPLQEIIGRMKSFVNRKCGGNLWQRSFYDHIIRDETDYLNAWNYIDGNPSKWLEDEYYVK
jgi:Transposase and inactivated derivatives